MKISSSIDLLMALDRTRAEPLHVQLKRELRAAVQTGRLAALTRLPSTRALASDLDVSRGVVVEAYDQLVAEGYLTAARGSATRVAALGAQTRRAISAQAKTPTPIIRYDFQPGIPDVLGFPRRAWLNCFRKVFNGAASDAFRYPAPEGPHATRAALADFLGRSRAMVCQADEMVMCTGFQQGIDLVMRLLKSRGVTDVALEDPGYGALDALLRSLEMTPHPVPIDRDGLSIEALGRTPAMAIIATPVHQYPTGVALSARRRAALLHWARQRDALIIEDDYDAEFRYDREPVGALQGMDPERVIYIGSASKTLSPALRLGWIVASVEMAADLAQLKATLDAGSAVFDQLALGEFIRVGELDRHIRRMRVLYRKRRALMVEALARHLPALPIQGISAGLHFMLDLPAGMDDGEVRAAALAASIGLGDVRSCRMTHDLNQAALILGYGCAAESSIAPGIQRLSGLIRQHVRA